MYTSWIFQQPLIQYFLQKSYADLVLKKNIIIIKAENYCAA